MSRVPVVVVVVGDVVVEEGFVVVGVASDHVVAVEEVDGVVGVVSDHVVAVEEVDVVVVVVC